VLKKSLISFAALMSVASFAKSYEPLSVPANIRVTSSSPRQIVWETLTPKEKKLATHLLKAALAGRDILYYQNHRHALFIKNVLEKALSEKNIQTTKALLGDSFKEFLIYSAKYVDQVGPYSTSNRKYVLKKVSPESATILFKKLAPLASDGVIAESVRLLTDPKFEVLLKPEDSDGAGLEETGNNIYEHGITGAEVTEAFKNGLQSNLNCRIVRASIGGLKCEVQALNNKELPAVMRSTLTKVIAELKKALPYASSEHQAKQIEFLIKYLITGDVEDFRQMNVHWVKDGTSSKVDFMMGWVEFQTDHMTQIASWESYVQIVDPKTTQLSVNLAKNAQAFEDQMPYGQYKKTFPEGYAPPAMMVYYFQELSSFRSGGYNLPNFDDIRRDVGAKNIIRLELPGQDIDPNTLKDRRQMYEAFAPASTVDDIVTYWTKGRQTKVLLHEIIGHGSGTYNTSVYGPKEDPTTALGALGSSLEEQRADLNALAFAADPIMVKVGMFKDMDEAIKSRNAMYDSYNANFLRDVSKQQSLSEAHQRGHWLMMNVLLEKGAIGQISQNGVLVYKITDYDKYQQVCFDLLGELQLIKAERKTDALKELYTKYGPLASINDAWMQAIIAHGKPLAINAGTIEQPWDIRAGKVHTYGTLDLEGIAPHLGK